MALDSLFVPFTFDRHDHSRPWSADTAALTQVNQHLVRCSGCDYMKWTASTAISRAMAQLRVGYVNALYSPRIAASILTSHA